MKSIKNYLCLLVVSVIALVLSFTLKTEVKAEAPQYETPIVLTLSDLTYKSNGEFITKMSNEINRNCKVENAFPANGSTVYRFKYNWEEKVAGTVNLEFVLQTADGENGQLVSYRIYPSRTEIEISGKDTTTGAAVDAGELTVEFGKLAVLVDGVADGNYYYYLSVNGTKMVETTGTGLSQTDALSRYVQLTVKSTDALKNSLESANKDYETADQLSISDLKHENGKKCGPFIALTENETYSYAGTAANYSAVLRFKYHMNSLPRKVDEDKYVDRLRVHFFAENSKWDTSSSVWFVTDATMVSYEKDGANKYQNLDPITETGVYDVEMSKLAILYNGVPTGYYQFTYKLNGTVVKSSTLKLDVTKMDYKFFLNASGVNYLEDVDYAFEKSDADKVTLLDFNSAYYLVKNTRTKASFDKVATSSNFSTVVTFYLNTNNMSEVGGQLMTNISGQDGWKSAKLLLKAAEPEYLFFAYEMADKPVDRYYINSDHSPAKDNETYKIEVGRIVITEGKHAGMDFVYLKVNDQYVSNQNFMSCFYTAHGTSTSSNDEPTFFMNTTNSAFTLTSLLNVNIEDEVLEEADVITTTDLKLDGSYMGSEMAYLASTKYEYTSLNNYGSTIFKFKFSTTVWSGNDEYASQVHFYDGYAQYGQFWLRGDGILIGTNKNTYIWTEPLTMGEHDIELARIAILDNEGNFSGNCYWYIKVDGEYRAKYVMPYPEGNINNLNVPKVFITGGANRAGNLYKAVSNPVTVSFTYNGVTKTVDTQRSGFIASIPEFTVPSDKKITGWVIKGTETKFDFNNTRVFEGMELEAVEDDFRYMVAFGEMEATPYIPGAAIVAPVTNPTKAYDNNKHYVFAGWFDGETMYTNETVATKDVTYVAKFNEIDHVYGEWSVIQDSTCSANGTRGKTCECGHLVTADDIEKKAHTEVTDPRVEATCAKAGLTEGKHCSVCNTVLVAQEEIEKLPHTEVIDEATATCLTGGLTEGKHCSVCNEVIIAQEEVGALGHDFGAPEADYTNMPNGYYEMVKKCSRCDATETDSRVELGTYNILANVTGSALDRQGYYQIDTTTMAVTITNMPTSTTTWGRLDFTMSTKEYKYAYVLVKGNSEGLNLLMKIDANGNSYDSYPGNKTYKKAIGENQEVLFVWDLEALNIDSTKLLKIVFWAYSTEITSGSFEFVKAGLTRVHTAHDYSDWQVVTPATCTTDGVRAKICDCGDQITEVIVATGHTEEIMPSVAATCSSTGLSAGVKCSVCQEILEAQEILDKKAHTEVVDAAVAPTCVTPGMTEGKHCSVCGEVIIEQERVRALGHTEVVDQAVAPTCTAVGKTEGKHCSVCGEVIIAQNDIPMVEHTYQNGVCAVCEAKDPNYVAPKKGCKSTIATLALIPCLLGSAFIVLKRKERN